MTRDKQVVRQTKQTPLHFSRITVTPDSVIVALSGFAPGRRVRLHAASSHFLWSNALSQQYTSPPGLPNDRNIVSAMTLYLKSRVVRNLCGPCAVVLLTDVVPLLVLELPLHRRSL